MLIAEENLKNTVHFRQSPTWINSSLGSVYGLAPITTGADLAYEQTPPEEARPTAATLWPASLPPLLRTTETQRRALLPGTEVRVEGMRPKPISEAFWARVERRGDDECWPWKGAVVRGGYGQGKVRVDGVLYVRAHRASWAIHHGPPGSLNVCHRCDNPPCCNPRHLFLGTYLDNNRDRTAKGRTCCGTAHRRARFTEDEVRAIRASKENFCALARRWGSSRNAVRSIVKRITWKHIP